MVIRRFVCGLLIVAGLTWAVSLYAQPRDAVRVAVLAPRGLGTLDPHFATAHYDRMVVSWLHGALVRFKPGSISPAEIEPDLAERWEVSADRRVWTFFLRPGATFHNGGAVTADDVAFSIRKASTAKTSAYAGDFASVESIEVLDPGTVRIVLKQPVPSLLGLLANYSGGFILSRQTAEGSGPAGAANGFGPFALASEAPGQMAAEFVANDRYFRGRPKLRRIKFQFVSALSTSDLAFNAGEVDIIEGQQDQAWINRTRQAPDAAVDVIEPAEISLLHLNVTQKPLDDARVRRAIALTINRPEMVAWRGADLARAAHSVIPAGYLGFVDTNLPSTTDVAEAKRLLAEAGYPNGLKLKTIHTQNPVMLGAIQVVQAELRRAGIDLDIDVVEHQTYHQMIRKDLSPVVHYAAARFPAADTMLTQFFHSRSIVATPTAVTNFSHCAVADGDLDAARGDTDLERQLALWADAQRKIVAADCAVPLLETRQVWARRANFDYGFVFKGSMSTGPLLTEQSHFTP